MSQGDIGALVPQTTSGTTQAALLKIWRDALHSGHSGAARPAYAKDGMVWVKVVSASAWDVALVEGGLDIVLGRLNPQTNSWTPYMNGAALGDAAARNQGTGNGLDADTLDGQHASAFAPVSSETARAAHAAATNNPHATTAAQVGALVSLDGVSNAGGNVDLVAGANVTITPNAATKKITIAAVIPPQTGEANTAANVGTGSGVFFRDKIGIALNFRTLKLGPNALLAGWSLTVSGNDVILEITPPPPPPGPE